MKNMGDWGILKNQKSMKSRVAFGRREIFIHSPIYILNVKVCVIQGNSSFKLHFSGLHWVLSLGLKLT